MAPLTWKSGSGKKLIGVSRWRVWLAIALLSSGFWFAPSAWAALRRGDRGGEVRQLQQALRSQGNFDIAVDGTFGLETEDAVRIYQVRNGLQVDGIAGSQTLDSLRLSSLIDDGSQKIRDTSLRPSSISVGETGDFGPYVVLIPFRGTDSGDTTLAEVRQILPDAYLTPSGIGSFIHAASFDKRSDARETAQQLRDFGFSDARVEYKP